VCVGKGPWRAGPPPGVGWWPASTVRFSDEVRWWDGHTWSVGALADYSREFAAWRAGIKVPDFVVPRIRWRQRADWWSDRSKSEGPQGDGHDG